MGPIQHSPYRCRQVQTESMLLKLSKYPDLPLQKDLVNYPPKRLKSRNSIWSLTLSNIIIKM